MNTQPTAMHNLIRRYCMERIDRLAEQHLTALRKVLGIYKETEHLSNDMINDKVYEKIISLSPKETILLESNEELQNVANVVNRDILNNILNNIESIDVEELKTIVALKEAIVCAISQAEIHPKCSYTNTTREDIKRISNDEKGLLYTYINSLDVASLDNVPPLFYRKVLEQKKVNELRDLFEQTWLNQVDIESMYQRSSKDIMNIDLQYFQRVNGCAQLRQLLLEKKIDKIYEINDCCLDKASYEMETGQFTLEGKVQSIWCTDDMEWAIYLDHEGFLLLCGQELFSEIKALF